MLHIMRRWHRVLGICACTVAGLCLAATVAAAQDNPRIFAGVVAGLSTLSADARSVLSPGGPAISLYKPENGPALDVFVGRHLHEYWSIQANYLWNRNAVALVEASFAEAAVSFSEQRRISAQ